MFQFDVFYDVSFLFEGFVAMDAGERFGIGVDQHVSFQFELGAQFLVTNLTSDGAEVDLVTQLLVLLESLQCGVGLVTGLCGTFEVQFSIVYWNVVPQVVLVVKLLPTGWTKVFVAVPLFVNISEVFQ